MKKLLCAFEVKTSGWNEKFEKFEEKNVLHLSKTIQRWSKKNEDGFLRQTKFGPSKNNLF